MTKPKAYTILGFKPNDPPAIQELLQGLKPMQDFVGGYIQMIPFTLSADQKSKLQATFNEEAGMAHKSHNYPKNRKFPYEPGYLRGNFFVTKVDRNGDPESLTDADITIATKYFEGTEL